MPLVPSTTPILTDEGVKAAPFTFNKQAVTDKINAVQDNMNTFVGKKNHNPFMWIKANLTPLIERIEGGETSKELQDAVMALSDDVAPIVNPELVETPTPTSTAPKLSPAGLNLPTE